MTDEASAAARTQRALQASNMYVSEMLFDSYDAPGKFLSMAVLDLLTALSHGDAVYVQSALQSDSGDRRIRVVAATADRLVLVNMAASEQAKANGQVIGRSRIRSVSVTDLQLKPSRDQRDLSHVRIELDVEGLAEPLILEVDDRVVHVDSVRWQRDRLLALLETLVSELR